jgi:hypothetical protein
VGQVGPVLVSPLLPTFKQTEKVYDAWYGGHASRDHTAADRFSFQLSLLKHADRADATGELIIS